MSVQFTIRSDLAAGGRIRLEAAAAAGVDVTLERAEGLPHVYPGMPGTPEAAGAADQAGAFLRDRLRP